MFSTVLTELKSYFGRDFLLGVFFPVLMFVGLSLALLFEITSGLSSSITAWEKLSLQTQGLLVLSLLVASTLASYLIYNFQYVVTRFFEGYWSRVPLLGRWRNKRVLFHQQRWDYLNALSQSADTLTETEEIIAEQLAYYPPPNHLDKMMATRLGNILRASEIYAYDRYGIDSAIIWTRLRPLLKTEDVTALEEKKTARDFMLLIAVLAASFTIVWIPVLALFTNRSDLFLLSAVGWPLAWLAYQNALQSALAYGEQIKAIFDLHRHDLLKALNRPDPADSDAERKEWLRLSRFFYRNVPLPKPPSAPEKPKGWERVANALADYLEKINQSKGRDEGEQE